MEIAPETARMPAHQASAATKGKPAEVLIFRSLIT
jgi:hypothetical protein